MARKNLLKDLMNPDPLPDEDTPETRVNPARPRYAGGAIGAVSQSIADLKSRALIEVDPFDIEAGGVQDRLADEEADHKALMVSLETYGQQVPILVRPHPDTPGKFQIVYGRRRVLALRDLGQPAKALVRDLDDQALIMAQGQENTARRDLSYIEKSNFARQMREAGYDRKAICDALSVDKTQISRMLSVVDTLGVDLIEAIGAAPGVGRDRWSTLATRFETLKHDADTIIGVVALGGTELTSSQRFELAVQAVGTPPTKTRSTPQTPRGKSRKLVSANGVAIGKALIKNDAVVLTLPRKGNGGFEDWMVDHIEEFHRQWLNQRGETGGKSPD